MADTDWQTTATVCRQTEEFQGSPTGRALLQSQLALVTAQKGAAGLRGHRQRQPEVASNHHQASRPLESTERERRTRARPRTSASPGALGKGSWLQTCTLQSQVFPPLSPISIKATTYKTNRNLKRRGGQSLSLPPPRLPTPSLCSSLDCAIKVPGRERAGGGGSLPAGCQKCCFSEEKHQESQETAACKSISKHLQS